MTNLTGSDKQINWATTIRTSVLAEAIRLLEMKKQSIIHYENKTTEGKSEKTLERRALVLELDRNFVIIVRNFINDYSLIDQASKIIDTRSKYSVNNLINYLNMKNEA